MSPGNQRVALDRAPTSEQRPFTRLAPVRACHIASGDCWAGAEAQVAGLLAALSRRENVSVLAIVLNEGKLAGEIRRSGIEVCVIPESKHGFLAILSRATEFLRNKQIGILHSHRYKENLLAAMLARRCKVPFIVRTQHGAPEPFAGWRRVKQSAIGIVDRFTARHFTDCVISVSEELGKGLCLYVPPGRLSIIHNGIDTETVRSRLTTTEAKVRLRIFPSCPVVGVVGRLEPVKRIDIFLKTARQVMAKLPESKFIIAGSGSLDSHLRDMAGDLGLNNHAMFLGHRDDIYDVLRAMDLLVLPSDHEGLPTSLLEAMFLQVPVLARPVGGIPEVIEDGVTGFLMNSGDPATLAEACLFLLAHDHLRVQVAVEGALAVKSKFSIEATAREMAALYRRLGEKP